MTGDRPEATLEAHICDDASMPSNSPRAAVAPDFLAAIQSETARMPDYLQGRGRTYFHEGRVGPLEVEAERASAPVHGSRTYRTSWHWNGEFARPRCTCPAGPWCKHAVALAEALKYSEGSGAPAPPDEDMRVAGELARWARLHADSGGRTLRVVLGLEREEEGDAAIWIEARVTSARLTDAPRTVRQVQSLAAELHANPRLLSPPQARLLRVLARILPFSRGPDVMRHRIGPGAIHRLMDSFSNAPLLTWSADAGVADGRPRLGDATVDVVPVAAGGSTDLRVALAARWPAGATRGLETVAYLPTDDDLSPSLVLADGIFWPVADAPPEHVIRRFIRGSSLEVPQVGREQFLAALASNDATVAESLGDHVIVHRARPLATLELGADDWVRVRLFATTTADWRPSEPSRGAIAFELTEAGEWVKLDGATPAEAAEPLASIASSARADAPEDGEPASPDGDAPPAAHDPDQVWLEMPAPEPLSPAREWLASLPIVHGGARLEQRKRRDPATADRGVWVHLTGNRVNDLAHAWERRPHGVEYLGNERMRGLLAGRRTVRTKLEITSSGVDWFTVSSEWQAEGLALTEEDLAKLRASTGRFVKLSSGWASREVLEAFDEQAAVLADLGIEPGAGDQRVTLAQLAQARPESLAALDSLGADEATLATVARLREKVASFAGVPPVEPPATLTATLRPYQREGLDFLAFVTTLGMGTVLADDMGLGKTVQALAWIEWLREREPDAGPVLVVCPASVVHNWQRESERFTPDLKVLVLASGEERHVLRKEVPQHDLVITNYALLRRDVEHWQKIPLRAAILDEAQNVKNPNTAVARAAFSLNAPKRLALTGTPIENRALDLWSILEFVNPGYLGRRSEFIARYDRPDSPPWTRRLLAARLRPVLIRRLKEQVAPDLPDRIEERQECELTPGQRRLYLAELVRGREMVSRLSKAPGGLNEHRIEVLALLTRLRQICCHPALVGGRADLGSGKFDALFELLEPLLAEGRKVLVFSQFVELLKLLGAEMKRRGMRYHLLTGATTNRERVVRGFEDDPLPCTFLISLKAGGTGLNLVAAQYVVVFDPWWNPAVEAQAIDRTHRIGQTRTVIAYRLMARGTVEEKIWELQQRKQALVQQVLGEDGFARTLTAGDLDYLLG